MSEKELVVELHTSLRKSQDVSPVLASHALCLSEVTKALATAKEAATSDKEALVMLQRGLEVVVQTLKTKELVRGLLSSTLMRRNRDFAT